MSKYSIYKADILIKIATAVIAKLSRVLTRSIGFPTNHRLFISLMPTTMLHGCEA